MKRAASVGLLAMLLTAAEAGAQQTLQLALSGCSRGAWSHVELLSGLHAELGPGYVIEAANDASQAQLELRCTGAEAVELRLAATEALPETTRRVSFADVPRRLRARAVSLAFGELLRSRTLPSLPLTATTRAVEPAPPQPSAAEAPASSAQTADVRGSEPAQPSAGAEASAMPAAPLEPVSHADARSAAGTSPQTRSPPPRAARSPVAGRPLQLGLGPQLRSYTSAGDVLLGAQLGLRWAGFELGMEALANRSQSALGEAHYGLGQGFLRYSPLRFRLSRSVGLNLGARAAAGPRLAGATPSVGARAEPARVLGWELALDAELGYGIAADWEARIQVLGGTGTGLKLESQPASGLRERLVSLSGWFVNAALVVAVRLGTL